MYIVIKTQTNVIEKYFQNSVNKNDLKNLIQDYTINLPKSTPF